MRKWDLASDAESTAAPPQKPPPRERAAPLPVFWQAQPRVWVPTDFEAAPFDEPDSEARDWEVWRPMAYAGAATGIFATKAIRHERKGLAPMLPNHPAAPVTVGDNDGYYQTFFQPGQAVASYMFSFPLTGVPHEVLRRLTVSLEGSAVTVTAELTHREQTPAGKPDLSVAPIVWRLFGRCELPADANADGGRVVACETAKLLRRDGRSTLQRTSHLVISVPRRSATDIVLSNGVSHLLWARAEARDKHAARPRLPTRTSTRDKGPASAPEVGGLVSAAVDTAEGLIDAARPATLARAATSAALGAAGAVAGAASSVPARLRLAVHEHALGEWRTHVEQEDARLAPHAGLDARVAAPPSGLQRDARAARGGAPVGAVATAFGAVNGDELESTPVVAAYRAHYERRPAGGAPPHAVKAAPAPLQDLQSYLEEAPAGTRRQQMIDAARSEGTTANW